MCVSLKLRIATYRIIAAGRPLLCLNLYYVAFAHDQLGLNATVSLNLLLYLYLKGQCLPHRKHTTPALIVFGFEVKLSEFK